MATFHRQKVSRRRPPLPFPLGPGAVRGGGALANTSRDPGPVPGSPQPGGHVPCPCPSSWAADRGRPSRVLTVLSGTAQDGSLALTSSPRGFRREVEKRRPKARSRAV